MDVESGRELVLRDGRWVRVRRLRPADGARITAFWQRLDRAARQRLVEFEGITEDRLATLSPSPTGTGLVAVASVDGEGDPARDERVLGLARYERTAADEARFWTFVDPAWRGAGLGTSLVRQLATEARDAGVAALVGEMTPQDTRMLSLLADLGLEHRRQRTGDGLRATVEVYQTDAYFESLVADQAAAARTTLAPFFAPRSIAVVGASDDPTSLGGVLWANLAASGFGGGLYPVNLHRRSVQGAPAYPDLASCPGDADLVVVCTPAGTVPSVVEQAGRAGARAVCVISAGFAEAGPQGRDRERHLVATARRYGMRLVGPNCMGLVRGRTPGRFNATFSPVFPPAGRLSFVSQSGALGLAALALLDAPALGIDEFVSVGNSADVSATDVLLYWGQDPGTDVIVGYLESVPDPRTFARVARHVSRSKPIVAVKAGRTAAGARAASSHTAALAAGDTAVEALFRQAGIIRADTLEELFDVATLLASQPVPPGRRVAVLTNGGGPGILVADACQRAGLLVPELSAPTQEQLRRLLPAGAAVTNPVDMVASSTARHYGQSLRILAGADEIDTLIVIFVPPFLTRAEDVAGEIAGALADLGRSKPVVASFMSSEAPPAALTAAGVPSFSHPERAAQALGRVATWAEWRQRPPGTLLRPAGVDRAAARRIVDRARPAADGWLDAAETRALLAAYGVPITPSRTVCGPEEAAQAAAELGCPVVVKLAAPIHKTDVGGVRLGLAGPEEAAAAVRDIRARLARAGAARYGETFLVQREISGGIEMLVGLTQDPAFGPLLAVGLGGTLVEYLDDVSVRMTPLTDRDVDEMLRSLRCYRLLTGYRGAPPADIEALKLVLYRLSAMAEDLPELAELDLNPLFVTEHGATAADVRIRVQPRS